MGARILVFYNKNGKCIYCDEKKYGISIRPRKEYCEIYVIDSVFFPGEGCIGLHTDVSPSSNWIKEARHFLVNGDITVRDQPKYVAVKGRKTRILLSVWEERLREIAATVNSESYDVAEESQAIARVIRNRAEYRNVKILSPNFWKDYNKGGVGGNSMYGRRSRENYKMWSKKVIMTWDGNLQIKLESTIKGLIKNEDITKGAYFWEANKRLKDPNNFFHKFLAKKEGIKTNVIGQSTFMKYNPLKEENPKKYMLHWP